MKKFLLILFLLGGLSMFGAIYESQSLDVKLTRPQVSYTQNITYSQPLGKMNEVVKLEMDIIKPVTQNKLPVVLFVTGGGFVGSLKSNYLQQRLEIAEAGYVVASIEYRKIPNGVFPEPLEDVKSAIRFLRANADKFGIDKNKIAVMGSSAGGYLVAMAGTTNGYKQFDKGDNLNQNSDVQAVIDIYGLSDLATVGEDFSKEIQEIHKSSAAPEALWLNGVVLSNEINSVDNMPEKVKAANPMTYITKDTPPFLLLHGDKDILVSPSQTEKLHKALVTKGIDSTRYIVKGAAHGGEYWVQPEVMKVIINFLNKNLKK
ncbi:alpha/beta hydrolase [Fusobacterium nucleatum subsp. nucleatum ATCC 23726]|uniref:BD-FAE-like domain-containing protein n=1 Tax=Fusobacterium nucleatum subsp. nucleatum (strain ATCC 23726 / VPI 4351) TaxID=525283 RepID=D5RCC1_FUSN2|nr:alpha/beta hydrolase [Fusobacterium nucleatum]AVQ22844.1 alpha/beta hydrolase [Fusobacterium nucleatum subsp. nucleatum ATCC 23726]EFG95534.1 hypothetical protein HMPREF0397_0856 [Fusobacterium nucleatum subsp. nucleatum ATCC 23726]ERT43858.1 hypothetical protein HMPREF1539_00337 [Fusobacterium nucleatum CTI-2]